MDNTSTPEYLKGLNPQQLDAVVYTDGPALVIAGAGSGKTRVLTYKIVHLLSHGFDPSRIMALTFTNKAAREMKERISQVCPKESPRLWMGTFHSIFLRILRRHAEAVGYKPDFTIYDTNDTRALIKTIVKDLELDEKVYKPATVASTISNAKNALVGVDIYLRDPDRLAIDKHFKRPETGNIYRIYTDRCRIANAMDFDDILYYMNILLRDNPDILRHYQEFFQYILVDEYQDTNFAQHLIIQQLSRISQKVCVVGDDAQSIYSFRGANIANILNLKQEYRKLKIFKLERNYRSTQTIINAAGSLIKKNSKQIPKNVYSENEVGSPIEVIKAYSDLEESFLVANSISKSKLTNHDSYDQYAILYRTNAQSRILEESLRKRNIPYRIWGGVSFYQRKEVRDAIAYFRLTLNPNDDEALKRIINYPARGIGETTLKKLIKAAIESNVSIMEVIRNQQDCGLAVNSGTAKKLTAFASLMDTFIADYQSGSNAFELAQLIYNRTGLLTSLAHDNTPEAISRQENLTELMGGLKEFVDLRTEAGEESISMADFLAEVSLATDQDEEDPDGEKVTLMTVHAAKGLEFSNIYIVGVEEDLFPSAMAKDSPAEVEEERRLLYVAITRAKNRCTISYAASRYRNGQTMATRPSRFLNDIEHQYLHFSDSAQIEADSSTPSFFNPFQSRNFRKSEREPLFNRKSPIFIAGKSEETSTSTSRELPDSLRSNSRRRDSHIAAADTSDSGTHSIAELSPGMKIRHERFGIGTITEVKSLSGDNMIIVEFENVGTKKLLLRFARFTIL